MTLKEEFENEVKDSFNGEFNGAAFLFATRNEKYIEWLEFRLSCDNNDFYTDLMALINNHCNNGLKKPDLIHKMKYALTSCELS